MLNLDAEKLEQALRQFTDRKEQLHARVEELNASFVSILGQKEETETNLRICESKLSELRRALVIASGIPEDIAAARAQIIELCRISAKSDSIKRRKTANAQMQKFRTDLQERCAHTFVVGYGSYGGSRSNDYEDAYLGQRKCIVCEFKELSSGRKEQSPHSILSAGEDIYTALREGPNRVVRGISRKEYESLNIWQPLEKILQDVVPAHFLQVIHEAIAESPV